MIKKITDWFWTMPVENPDLKKDGWQEYQIVETGNGFRLSMARTIESGIGEIRVIASGIETMDRAIKLANEHDADNYGKFNVLVLAIAAIMIPLSVYLILSLS